jgi:imidazole glycerol-phosphate synthase subunit HisF
VNSIDADGTKTGFDLELTTLVKKHSSVPVIASGGAGELVHFVEAAQAGADALLAASVFHDNKFQVSDVKAALQKEGIEVR